MRQFDAIIFMGGGEFTCEQVVRLLLRVNECLSLNSAWQQGAKLTREDHKERREIVEDIAAALLGRRIKFTGRLPYPGKKYTGFDRIIRNRQLCDLVRKMEYLFKDNDEMFRLWQKLMYAVEDNG